MEERQNFANIITQNKLQYRELEAEFEAYMDKTKHTKKENVQLRKKAELLDWGSVDNNRQYKVQLRSQFQSMQLKLKQEDANMRLKWHEVERMVERLNMLEENYIHVDSICRQFLRRLPKSARQDCKAQLDDLRTVAMRHTSLHTKHEYMRLFGLTAGDDFAGEFPVDDGKSGDALDVEMKQGFQSLRSPFEDVYIPPEDFSPSKRAAAKSASILTQAPLTAISSPLFDINFDAPQKPPSIQLKTAKESSKAKLLALKKQQLGLAGSNGWTK
jgi:hypothetical protein